MRHTSKTWDEDDTKAVIEFDKWFRSSDKKFYYDDFGEFVRDVIASKSLSSSFN